MRVYKEVNGKLTELAKHFSKPYGTIQGWASTLREPGYPVGRLPQILPVYLHRPPFAAARRPSCQHGRTRSTPSAHRSAASTITRRGTRLGSRSWRAGAICGWLACQPAADSWTAPLDSRRVLVGENANVVAAQ
jgi:hypothetical protein